MFHGEGMRAGALEVENADQAVLHEQRHNDFRARVNTGFAADVAGIFTDVVDAQDAALSGSRTRKAFVKRDARACGQGVARAHREDGFKKLRLLVPKHDAEHIVVDDFFDALGDAPQKLFAVENGGQRAAHIVKERQRLSLLGEVYKKTRRNSIRISEQGEWTKLSEIVNGRNTSTLSILTRCQKFRAES